jgi:hypothetical protein
MRLSASRLCTVRKATVLCVRPHNTTVTFNYTSQAYLSIFHYKKSPLRLMRGGLGRIGRTRAMRNATRQCNAPDATQRNSTVTLFNYIKVATLSIPNYKNSPDNPFGCRSSTGRDGPRQIKAEQGKTRRIRTVDAFVNVTYTRQAVNT